MKALFVNIPMKWLHHSLHKRQAQAYNLMGLFVGVILNITVVGSHIGTSTGIITILFEKAVRIKYAFNDKRVVEFSWRKSLDHL
jgi:hypothetical protein